MAKGDRPPSRVEGEGGSFSVAVDCKVSNPYHNFFFFFASDLTSSSLI
jgi:hypothetical protein